MKGRDKTYGVNTKKVTTAGDAGPMMSSLHLLLNKFELTAGSHYDNGCRISVKVLSYDWLKSLVETKSCRLMICGETLNLMQGT